MLLRSLLWCSFWIPQDCIQTPVGTCLLHIMVGYIQLHHTSVWLHECILFLGLLVYQQRVTCPLHFIHKAYESVQKLNTFKMFWPYILLAGTGKSNCHGISAASSIFKVWFKQCNNFEICLWNLTAGGNNRWFWLFGVINSSAWNSWESDGRRQSLGNAVWLNSSFQYGCPKHVQYCHHNS